MLTNDGILQYFLSADLSKSFPQSFVSIFTFSQHFLNRFLPVQKCGFTPHCLYHNSLTLKYKGSDCFMFLLICKANFELFFSLKYQDISKFQALACNSKYKRSFLQYSNKLFSFLGLNNRRDTCLSSSLYACWSPW